jgi:flagellar hook assembly protein FlgD
LTFTQSLAEARGDTTIHWVYFDEPGSVTHVTDDDQTVPLIFKLKQNYPNPFNNQTRISYVINAATSVNLKVYDIQGRLIATLLQRHQPAGSYSVVWNTQQSDGTLAPSGIYFIRLETNGGVETRKTLLVR